tara:strand:+ start:180 stop:566 length:387 start_codon:yes stop_codon:yes gene_type:complete
MADKKKILIVDDEKNFCYLVKKNLALTKKYKVMVAKAGSIGMLLSRLRWHKPDLILLDVSMPGLDGFEVLRRLKKDPKTSKIPVVMLTVRDDSRAKKKAQDLKCDDYLIKPVSVDTLVSCIESLTNRE